MFVTQKDIDAVKYKNLSMAYLKAQWQLLEKLTGLETLSRYISHSAKIQREWKRWVDSYAKYNPDKPERVVQAAFEQHWKVLRLRVPLQDRLVIEQILWEKGGWRAELVKGFYPIGYPKV